MDECTDTSPHTPFERCALSPTKYNMSQALGFTVATNRARTTNGRTVTRILYGAKTVQMAAPDAYVLEGRPSSTYQVYEQRPLLVCQLPTIPLLVTDLRLVMNHR